ncbi:MAG: glycoside hydrolase family 3 C-terminal domain-containing protein [Lachnospiraceae bacterium]|nr:glycoside hydrolase family 3 C-terminal domain-containing protein [Lachnospiraceae bacterium]
MQEEKKRGALRELAPFCRKAAADGAVLLKNEEGMLPITKEDRVAVFGRSQINYYKSGIGSGGLVNVEYTTNLIDGFRQYTWVRLHEQLVKLYEEWTAVHPACIGDDWATEPWHQEEMPLEDTMVKEAAAVSNKAIIVLGRTAGEDRDNADAAGSYRLAEDEIAMISLVTKYFSDVAVVFNVSNIIDMSWTTADWCHGSVKALLYVWHGGMEGGNAAADVLVGAVSPSGHLTDTIARSIEDYPAHANYGSDVCNFYEEDIYVGYRYFETFCPEKVLYPFGFGLSYTTFSWEAAEAKVTGSAAESCVEFQVRVENTGAYAGREVLQVYVEAPQGLLGKAGRVLAAFAKTKLLAAGESQVLDFHIPIKRFASYDDGGVTGNKSCFVLEAGAYRFLAGVDCRRTKEVLGKGGKAPFVLEELLVTERLHEAAAPVRSFRRMKPLLQAARTYKVVYEDVPLRTVDLEKRILENLPDELPAALPVAGEKEILFGDVLAGRASLETFTSQLSLEELAVIVRGEGMCNARVTPGTAAAFGGVSDDLAARGIPAGCAADGPSGIRMDTGEKATQLPGGTLLACSFDEALVEELFYLEGQELCLNEVDTLLGPGINIHRHPLNGRNFEYFSEDPYVTGAIAAACERGMGRAGVTGTMKHFACNNQEQSRHRVDAVVSERALREIYLKGFEIAVKEGGGRAVMTTYNPMNGYQNATNYDLNTVILREEWGYTGLVMTDWWAGLNDVVNGGAANLLDMRSMVRAQNDVYMVVNNNGAAINARGDNTLCAVAEGSLTKGELQRCAMNILRFLLASPVAKREVRAEQPIEIRPLGEAEAAEKASARKAEAASGLTDLTGERVEKEKILINVEHDGLYSINVTIMSDKSDRAQMLCRLCLNGEEAGMIQTNGTRGNRYIQRIGKAVLSKGLYELSAEHIKPGIALLSVQFVML